MVINRGELLDSDVLLTLGAGEALAVAWSVLVHDPAAVHHLQTDLDNRQLKYLNKAWY